MYIRGNLVVCTGNESGFEPYASYTYREGTTLDRNGVD